MGRRVSFWATKKVPRKVNVRFKTYDGRVVRFQATKKVPVRRKVTFFRRRRW